MSMKLEYGKKDYEIYIYKNELTQDTPNGEKYFRQKKIAMIGTNKYKSPIDACAPKFTPNINGKKTLTFNMYYKFLNPSTNEYEINPYVDLIKNETWIALKMDGDWYDLIITKVLKNSDGTVYTYTAEDRAITELGKNGFNAELALELENNMGTITELGETILNGSDWQVDKEGSDLIIQSLEDALYSVEVENLIARRRTNYLPDAYYIHQVEDHDGKAITGTIYVFYTDIKENRQQVGFLYTENKEPELNADGTIVNSYNYYCARDEIGTIPNKVSDYRGRRVVRSPKTFYDYDLKRTMTRYKEKGGSDEQYYGFSETDYISPEFVRNYISNSYNMTSLYDWVRLYDVEEGVGKEKTIPHLRVETMPFPAYSPYVSYINANGEFLNKGIHGYRTTIKNLVENEKYVLAIVTKTEGYSVTDPENPLYIEGSASFDVNNISLNNLYFKVAFYKYLNHDRNSVECFSDQDCTTHGSVFGANTEDGYVKFHSDGNFEVIDPYDNNKRKTFTYMEIPSNVTITDITKDYGLDYNLGCFFKATEDTELYEVMFFKKYVVNDRLVFPSQIPPHLPDNPVTQDTVAQELMQTYYYLYKNTEVTDSSSGKSVLQKVLSKSDFENNWEVIYNESCEKIGSITGKEKNYYTLLSDLTKSFDCWMEFIYERDDNGDIIYEEFDYDKYGHKIDAKYQWRELTSLSDSTLKAVKKIDWLETFTKFLPVVESTDAPSAQVSTKIYTAQEVKGFYTNYIYELDFSGYGAYPHLAPRYFQLEKIVDSSIETITLKRPKKLVRFKNYLNDTPNWAGFKYGINDRSIQRTEDAANFSTKVVVKNNANEFATNKFASIARSQWNPTKDNFIIDFSYYIRHGFLDQSELNEDLYGENGLFTQLSKKNGELEEITATYIAKTVDLDKKQANWETYYLAEQAAQENILKYQTMLSNCGDEFTIDLTDWYVGGLWPVRDHTYIVKIATNREDMTSSTEYPFFTGLQIDPDRSGDYTSPLDGIELKVLYFNEGKMYGVDSETQSPAEYDFNEATAHTHKSIYYDGNLTPEEIEQRTYYYYIQDEPTEEFKDYLTKKFGYRKNNLDNIKRHGTYRFETGGNNTTKKPIPYHNKADYYFNHGMYTYCQKIDELLIKRQIHSAQEEAAEQGLNALKQEIEVDRENFNNKLLEKEEILRRFLIKYADFIKESSWTSEDYMDDDLYYLDARDSLHTAAFPKVSYTINVANIADLENCDCYKMKVGDYTFIEDVEFFGYDDKKRPAKEWVVLTEATYDLESPEKDTFKVQNYKSQIEDLFSRLSASLQNLELNKGGYNRQISNESFMDNFVFDKESIHSKNYNPQTQTGWALYSNGTAKIFSLNEN